MDNCKFDSLSIAPLQHKNSCEIKADPDLLRLVSHLGIKKKGKLGGENSLTYYF